MVDKESTPGSITEAADSSQERVAEISNVSRTISEMQRKVNQQVDETKQSMGDIQGIEETQNSMNSVLSNLNKTISSIGQGFAKVAASTAKASGDLVRGYGKAISQDISYNKQNVIAMAMARSTPLFGYFAAKFVETDVFQKAKERMKTSLGEALGSVTTKFKEGFSSLFSKLKSKKGDKEVSSVTNKTGKVPMMQHGGYVEKGGLAKLHAAEVVMPIEKVLEKIDDTIKISRELATLTKKAQLNTLAKLGTYVADSREMQKVGIFKGFLRAIRTTQTQYEQPAQQRMLRAVLSIQDSMGATIGTWPQVWQKMLIQHPTFRQLVFFSKTLSNAIASPFKFVYQSFKSRGGYKAHLSHAKNPMVAAAENIGLVYSEGMWRLDNIAKFTRATAEATRDVSTALTGKKYPQLTGVRSGIWSLFGLGKAALNWVTKWTPALGLAIADGVLGISEGKKGWALGKTIGESLTKEREFFFQKWIDLLPSVKERKGIYGTGGILEGEDGKTAFGVPLIEGAIPVIDVNSEEGLKQIEEYMKQGQKNETKLLGYNKHMDKVIEAEFVVTKRMDDREKRRSIFAFLGGMGGAAKSLLGMVSGFLGPLLGMIGLGGLGGLGKGGIGKKLTGLLFGKTGVLSKGITGLLANPVVWQAGALALSGAIGYALGKGIDKMLGISTGFQEMLDEWDQDAKAFTDSIQGQTRDLAKKARQGGVEGYKHRKTLGLVTQISTPKEHEVGFFGFAHTNVIARAQEKFIQQHAKDYSVFDSEIIKQTRQNYEARGGFRAKWPLEDPEKYGYKREAAFLKELQRIEKPMTAVEKQKEYKKFQSKRKTSIAEKGIETFKTGFNKVVSVSDQWLDMVKDESQQLTEKVVEATKTGIELGKEKGEELIIGAKAIGEKIGIGTKETLTGWNKLGSEMGAQFAQSTNVLNTSINNNSQQVTNTNSGNRGYASEYIQRVMRGDLDD